MKLLDYEFELVQILEPVLDREGNIMEVRPQDRYPQNDTKLLHAYGDGTFCKFSINPRWSGVSGVYAFFVEKELVYVGQCLDFAARFNTGYGNISPRACYVGGQSTNCKINQMVLQKTMEGNPVSLYFHMTHNYHVVEKDIIQKYKPEYNKMLINGKSSASKKLMAKEMAKSERKRQVEKRRTNLSVDEVRAHINTLLIEARERGEQELVLRSGLIHKELGMINALPSVCSAMRTVGKLQQHEILEAPPKGNGSRLVYRFYW